jgi:hypothetical protein
MTSYKTSYTVNLITALDGKKMCAKESYNSINVITYKFLQELKSREADIVHWTAYVYTNGHNLPPQGNYNTRQAMYV